VKARAQDLLLVQRGAAAGLPGWVLERLRGGGAPGLIRAATRWIEDLEAEQAHGVELARRLEAADRAGEPEPDKEEDTRAAQDRIRRALGLEAARRLAEQDPGGALAVLDDTGTPLPRPSGRSRAHERVLDLAAREGSLGVLPALTPTEHEALQQSRTPAEAMNVIITAARRVKTLAREAREVGTENQK
jgi:hypothetical protein